MTNCNERGAEAIGSKSMFVDSKEPADISLMIIEQAKSFGASLAGIASVAALTNSPSYQSTGLEVWPPEAKSALVLALAHPEREPELDWWGVQGGTAGNRQLQLISDQLKRHLAEAFNIAAQPLAYQVEIGGIFLKDAAVLAGLGTIGANKLLITPEFGPRVRLRALFLDVELAQTGPLDFSPCESCGQPCWAACPQQTFGSGTYQKPSCEQQMQADRANSVPIKSMSDEASRQVVDYCRACELACPVGP
jgi:epoxyqueuosine reductase